MSIVLDIKDLKDSREFFELKPSKGILVFVIILLTIVSTGILMASFMEIDDVVKANAILRPVGNISSMYCISGGQIKKKSYENDMTVRQGDPLWEIDVQSDRIDLENSRSLLKETAKDAIDMSLLLDSVNADKNMATEEKSQGWIMSEAWIGEIEALKQKANQDKIRLERELAMPANMSSAQKIADLKAEAEASLTAIENSRSRKALQCAENIKALRQNSQTLERRIKNATVTAPISGRIAETRRINAGDYMIAGEEILKIVPQENNAIRAELQVDPSDIARLEVGQKVSLRFPALPPSDFGQLEASISVVPADVTLGTGNIAIFLVEAEIPNAFLTAPNGDRIQLRSGMGAQARIKLSRETVFRMVLHKVDFIDKVN
jgi:multidrug resistance efflux pump